MMRQWTMKSRPYGIASHDNFSLETVPIPTISAGEILIKTLYLGVAPVMLRYMLNEASFERPMNIGDVMIGRGVGRVVESRHEKYKVGDVIQAKLGWREFAVADGNDSYFMIHKMNHTDLPLSHGISTLAMSGFTVLIGMRDICRVKSGDKVLVSGAAGGVGSQAAFVAKCLGAETVVGIAGGSEKCRILTEELGYDAAIDYKNEDLETKLNELFPAGIDVYFDNVFGETLDLVLAKINRRGRIALCGRMSEYLKSPADYHKFRNLHRLGLQDAKLEAFFVYDYIEHFTEYETQLAAWIREGKLRPREDVLNGIEQMPEALISLYRGDNVGVRMVRIG